MLDTSMPLGPSIDADPSVAVVAGTVYASQRLQTRTDAADETRTAVDAAPTKAGTAATATAAPPRDGGKVAAEAARATDNGKVATEAAATNAGTDAAVPTTAAVGAASAAIPPAPARTATATTTQVGTPSTFPAPPSAAGGIGGAVTALVVVVALILALAWLAKRMPVLGGGVGSNPALRIVGSLALGPRERLVVVAVGDTQLLLGVGAGGTRNLHTLDQPLPAATATTPAFAQLLAQHFGKKA